MKLTASTWNEIPYKMYIADFSYSENGRMTILQLIYDIALIFVLSYLFCSAAELLS